MRSASPVDQALPDGVAPAARPVDELQRFERLLLDLSARFINLPAERIDDAIDEGLRRIVEVLDIERSSLNSRSPATGRIQITHSFAAPGVERITDLGSRDQAWPWAWSIVEANRPIVFERLDDLPPEASVDRASYERIGLKSHVTMPMIVDGELYGGLSFGSVRRERTWPEPLLARMRLLAEIFGSALARKRVQEDLDRAIGFERLASGALASLLLAPPGDEAGVIEAALGRIGAFVGVERSSLWERLPRQEGFRRTHQWGGAGIRVPDGTMLAADFPWVSARLLEGSVVQFTRPAELAAVTGAELAGLRERDVRSLFAVPFSVAGEIAGALVLANLLAERVWPETLIAGVRLLAEVFASLHARQSAERRKQSAELEAAQWRERLAHLVRVHTAGEMSAALAHEITQPLGAIENYALAARRRAGEELPDLGRVMELLDKVIGQATRAGDVVTRMRAMVRRHELEPTEIDVERAVRDCVDMVKTDCELRAIRIEVRPAGPLPVVVADEIHLQQVVLNLLRNAMEAVELPRPGVERRITVETLADGAGGVTVRVADRGPGIAEGDLERVFESFYSTKPSGLGIGLAICRKLIEVHGGALWASHNPGGGAIFQFTLPATTVD